MRHAIAPPVFLFSLMHFACGRPAPPPDTGPGQGVDAPGTGALLDAAADVGSTRDTSPVGELMADTDAANTVAHTATLALPGPTPPSAPGPLAVGGVVSEAARWAFERLAPDHPEQGFLKVLLGEVEASVGKDEARAEAAIARIVAALAQLLDDEANGRDSLQASPFWGASASSARRELRVKLVQLVRSRHGERPHARLAPVVAWLAFEEPLLDNVLQGATMLERQPWEAARPIVVRILCEGSPNVALMKVALERSGRVSPRECRQRRLEVLCAHPHRDIRAAVEKAGMRCEAKEGRPVPEYVPEIEALVGTLSARVPFALDPARLERVSLEYPRRSDGRTLVGVVAEETPESLRIQTVHGVEERVWLAGEPKVKVTRTALALDAVVAELGKARAKADREARAEALSTSGMLTGQFEPDFISGAELVVAELLERSGRHEDAVAFLTPRLAEVPDARWLDWAARDLLGGRLHEAMLRAWTLARDTEGALAMARRLCAPAFAGYTYQARTCLVAAQLELRREDWRDFSLPTRERWSELAQTMTRVQQVEYLAERVRLRNTQQWGQPGGVDFLDAQYDRSLEALALVGWHDRKAFEVINPLVALRELAPFGDEERRMLQTYASSPALMAMYSYWRDFHPARTLHTVGEAVTWLLGEVDKAGSAAP